MPSCASATPGFVQTVDTVTAGATATTVYPSNNTAGNTLISVILEYGGLTSNETLSTFSDTAGNSWGRFQTSAFQNGSTSKFGDAYVFIAYNCKSGANTVSATFANSGSPVYVASFEYSGLSTYSLEGVGWRFGTSGSSLNSANVQANSGDLLFGVGFLTGSTSVTWTTPSGYTQRKFYNGGGNPFSMVEYDQVIGSTGAQSITVVPSTSSGGYFSMLFSFRPTNPTPGMLQTGPFTTSTSQAYLGPNLAGDTLIAMCRGTGGASAIMPTDSKSNTWAALPVGMVSDSNDGMAFAYAKNVAAGANTVTCSGANGIAIWEITGVDSTAPLAGSSSFFTNSASISSLPTGSITVPSTSVLFSVGANIAATGNFYTPTSGFQPELYFSSTDSFQEFSEVVSAGTYSNSITASTAQSYPQSFIVAFSTTTITYPILRQHYEGGESVTDVSDAVTFPSGVKSGNLIFAVVANQSGQSPGTMTDSQSNTYHLIAGGGAAQYGVYWAKASSTGADTVTNSHANCVGISEFDNTGSFTIDQSNTAVNASATSISTGSITTGSGNELVIAMGSIINTTSRLFFSSMSAGWNQQVYGCGGHYPSFWLGWQSQAPAASYSNTFTWAGSASPVTASIASFTTAASISAQPSVSIISKAVKPRMFMPGVPFKLAMNEVARGL